MDLQDVYDAYLMDERFRATGLYKKKAPLVCGRGSDTPKVMIVGPAPSAVDTVVNRVFDGQPGVVLESLMKIAGLYPHWTGKQTGLRVPPGCAEGVPPNAWLTYLVKWRHPATGRPTLNDEITSTEHLRREWAALGGPKIIVAVGDLVWKHLAPAGLNAGSIHWAVGQEFPMKGGVALWPMYHPNYGIKHEEMREKMEGHWEQFGKSLREDGVL